MATDIHPPQPVPAAPEPQPAIRESLVDDRLRRTRRQVRGVDVASGMLTLVIGAIGYLFLAALADHWLLVGGLGFWGRFLTLVVLVLAGGTYLHFFVLRPLLRRINPIFVAQTIESSRPSLKNSLVNFLLFRRAPREVAPAVYRAIERRAEDDVAPIRPEAAVDRRHVLHLCYALTVLVAIGAIYHVASPKNPLSSAFRVLLPWADIPAPTRVTIDDVEPGDAVAFFGQEIAVSAEVRGTRDDEQVMLYYTTDDGQSVDQAVPMAVPDGEYRYQCKLPPDSFGLQQDLDYYLAIGDCRTPTFHVTVQISPSIAVDTVRYHYPDYTGLPGTVRNQADLRAIEGTRVALGATANTPIRRAEIDLDCKGLREVKMTVDGKVAIGEFTLRMRPDDPTLAEHDSYQIRFTDTAGRENRHPIRHEIEVIPDQPPRVDFVDPPEERIQLPENGSLELKLRAEDPDFALREVVLRAERGGKGLPIAPLLNLPSSTKAHEGPFEGTLRFEPSKLGLAAGDEVVYWGEAKDNKEPLPGRAETPRRWITIVKPQDQNPQQQQPPENQPKENPQGQPPKPDEKQPQKPENQDQQKPDQQKPDEQKPGEQGPGEQGPDEQKPDQDDQGQKDQGKDAQGNQDQQDQQKGNQGKEGQQDQQKDDQGTEGQPGQQQEGSGKPGDQTQKGGQVADKPSKPLDGDTQPGDVFDKVLKQREKQQEGKQQQPEQQKPGEPKSGGQASGEQKPGEQTSGEQKPGEQKPGEQKSGEQKPGEEKPGEQKPSEQKAGEQKAGETPAQKSPDNEQLGKSGPQENKPGAGQGEQAKPTDEQADQEPDAKKPGEKSEAPGGDPDSKKGPAGAGQKSADDQKTPSTQQQQQRDKTPQPQQDEKTKNEEPPSSSVSPKESDSQGDTSGEQSGGGEKGGGQRADKPGAGTAGQNTEAEQGASQGKQQGQGETSDKPGQQDTAEGKTGQSSKQQPGDGSQAQKQPGGDGSAAQPGDQPQPQNTPPDQQTSNQPGGPNPTGGGLANQGPPQPPPPAAEAPPADPFNREYSEKQTDLALEYLKDQLAKEKPDQELLDALGGWTREDLDKFVQRWEAMKRAAGGEDDQAKAARAKLDDALRSLGLREPKAKIGAGVDSDAERGMKESRRIRPPRDWQEQIDAYRRSLGQQQ